MLLRSLLFMPGDSEKILGKAEKVKADAVIFDLEDAVSLDNKEQARGLVAEKLASLDSAASPAKKYFVRVNALNTGLLEEDLSAVISNKLTGIMLPKTEEAADVQKADHMLKQLEEKNEIAAGSLGIILLFESARGILAAPRIISASDRVLAAALGGEDLSLDLNAVRTREGQELFYSRSRLVLAASAAQIPALDTVFTDFKDSEGLEQDSRTARRLGFTGKLAIHPGQLEIINQAFTPEKEEIEFARRVVEAQQQAGQEGRAVYEVEGRMIDPPVVERARKLLKNVEELENF